MPPRRCGVIQVIERPPTPFPVAREVVNVATERWLLEPWHGDDPPELKKIWSIKPKYTVAGARSCAELAIVDQLVRDRWGAAWVSAFAGAQLRTQWYPAEGFRAISQAGAPAWAVDVFNRLRTANGGRLGGFFDVFAWHESDRRSGLPPRQARRAVQRRSSTGCAPRTARS